MYEFSIFFPSFRLSCFAFFSASHPPGHILSLFFMIIEWLEINCAPSSSIRTTMAKAVGGNVSCWKRWKNIKLLQVAMGTEKVTKLDKLRKDSNELYQLGLWWFSSRSWEYLGDFNSNKFIFKEWIEKLENVFTLTNCFSSQKVKIDNNRQSWTEKNCNSLKWRRKLPDSKSYRSCY